MSERMLEAFREEAELLTAVPAFEMIEQRGRARRRRRHAAVGTVAASALAVAGILAATGDQPRTQEPAEPALAPVDVVFPGLGSPPEVTYERPEGWAGRLAGAHTDEAHERNLAQFGAYVVEQVAKDPCRASRGPLDFRPAATEPAPLAAQLASMARVRVVLGPVPDDRFGLPGLHLQLQGTSRACTTTGGGFVAFHNFAFGGDWPDPVGEVDLWLVDVGDQVVVVEAVSGRQVSPEDRSTLARLVDSVVITPPAPD